MSKQLLDILSILKQQLDTIKWELHFDRKPLVFPMLLLSHPYIINSSWCGFWNFHSLTFAICFIYSPTWVYSSSYPGDGHPVSGQVWYGKDSSVRTGHPAADRTCGWSGELVVRLLYKLIFEPFWVITPPLYICILTRWCLQWCDSVI